MRNMKYGFYSFSCKYRYDISYNHHLKQASQTHTHKGSSETKQKRTIYAATILRLISTQQ